MKEVALTIEKFIELKSKGKKMTAIGGGPTMTVEKTVAITPGEDGSILAPANELVNAANAFQYNFQDTVTVVTKHKPKSIILSCGDQIYIIKALSEKGLVRSSFEYEDTGEEVHLTMLQEDMKDAFANTSNIALYARNKNRFQLSGVYMKHENDEIEFVATDTFVICGIRKPAEFNGEFKALIPAETVKSIEKLLGEGEVQATSNFSSITLKFSDTVVTAQGISIEEFPEYERLFKNSMSDIECKASVKKEETERILKVLAFIANESEQETLKAKVSKNEIEIVAENPNRCEGKDKIPCEYDGKSDFQFGVSRKYFEVCLKPIEDEEFFIHFSHPHKALYLENSKTKGYRALLMPIRIDGVE